MRFQAFSSLIVVQGHWHIFIKLHIRFTVSQDVSLLKTFYFAFLQSHDQL